MLKGDFIVQFWFLLVKVMVTGLICQEWGKPTKHQNPLGLYSFMARWECPGTSSGVGGFTLHDTMLWIMGHYGSLWLFKTLQLPLLWTQLNPLWSIKSCEYLRATLNFLCSPGGEFSHQSRYVREDTDISKITISPHKICLLAASFFVVFKTQKLLPVMGVHSLGSKVVNLLKSYLSH